MDVKNKVHFDTAFHHLIMADCLGTVKGIQSLSCRQFDPQFHRPQPAA
jgi:hypothetical protein